MCENGKLSHVMSAYFVRCALAFQTVLFAVADWRLCGLHSRGRCINITRLLSSRHSQAVNAPSFSQTVPLTVGSPCAVAPRIFPLCASSVAIKHFRVGRPEKERQFRARRAPARPVRAPECRQQTVSERLAPRGRQRAAGGGGWPQTVRAAEPEPHMGRLSVVSEMSALSDHDMFTRRQSFLPRRSETRTEYQNKPLNAHLSH